ncbi:hypothetical protein BGZ65_006536 [Modicella reniformis]|uniref:Reverse transcriptase RNase H-like domain-containing protein n=1 Tax=Modicella reniformis TaxID=1440133 RepID=A0A9P6J571_9FUNG|nr:hypothetical protein BGZ65_006536 [Modicella reniformis]
MARALKPRERTYPAYKKELLGIIYACRKFHYYPWGRKFTLYTDHRQLAYIQAQDRTAANPADRCSHDTESDIPCGQAMDCEISSLPCADESWVLIQA